MSETQEAPVLTAEQQQRILAVEAAGKVLRDGGATLVNNSGKAGDVREIIDLASFIATGVPFTIAWAHEHVCNPEIQVFGEVIDGSVFTDFFRMFDKEPQPAEANPKVDDLDDPFN